MKLGVIDPKQLKFEVKNSVRGHSVAVESIKGQKRKSEFLSQLKEFFQKYFSSG